MTQDDLARIFSAKGSNAPLLCEAAERAENLLPALLALFQEPQEARIDVVAGALDYLPLQDWSPLIEAALDEFCRDSQNKVAQCVLGNELYLPGCRSRRIRGALSVGAAWLF